MTNLPNFLIVGAAKSGTTSLYHYLKGHPEIFMCSPKEPHFICSKPMINAQNGIGDKQNVIITDFNDYCELFEKAYGKKAVGEASTAILYYFKESIPIIHEYIGNPKIIILLRNPAERAFSAYKHLRRDHREFLSFEDALSWESKRITQGWNGMWHYKNRGMYFKSVNAFIEQFPFVKVILFDEFIRDPGSITREIFAFLDVDCNYVPNLKARYNASGIPKFESINRMFVKKNLFQKTVRTLGRFVLTEDRYIQCREKIRSNFLTETKMKQETRIRLQEEFKEDIQKLEKLLNRDLSAWLYGT